MKAGLTIGVKAEYKLIRRKAVTDDHGNRVPGPVTEETPWTKNILTLTYFNQALTNTSLNVRGMAVGAGTTAAAEGQSALVSFLAATTNRMDYVNTFNSTLSPRYVEKMFRYRFGEGVAAGNIAEVGMFTSASSGTNSSTAISSRARVVDGLGAPTVVTVLSDEFLDVIWRCRWYVPEDVTGSCNISIDGVPTPFDWTIRAIALANGGTSWWTIETIGFCPTSLFIGGGYSPALTPQATLLAYDYTASTDEGADKVASSASADAYVANSKNRTFRFVWGLDKGNTTFRSIIVRNRWNTSHGYSLGAFQILLNNPITKVGTKSFTAIINMAMDNVP